MHERITICIIKKVLLSQKFSVTSFIKNTHNSNFLVKKKDTQKLLQCIAFIFFNALSSESGSSSTCSSVKNILDLKNQISCCQNSFLSVNRCIEGNYIANDDSLLLIILSFRLIVIKMNLQVLFNLRSFNYEFLMF